MPSKRTARIGALTVATICSTVSAVVLTSSAEAESIRIHDIQGTTRTSPLTGQQVAGVQGVVTGVRTYGSRGFWIQDPKADTNPATSEGVFVFTSSRPTVSVGDAVTVAGTVGEFVPGGTSSGNQSVTQITRPTITVVSTGNAVPAATVIDTKSVPKKYAPVGDSAAAGSINGLKLAPATYALDRYESLEGMNVQVADTRVVGATDPFTELWVTVKPRENDNRRGGALYDSYTSQNTGRLQIQSLGAVADFPKANVGDVLKGTTSKPAGLQPVRRLHARRQPARHPQAGRPGARDDPQAGERRARGGDVQRREPGPLGRLLRRPRGRDRAQPAVARHRGPGGDPGQQRFHQRRYGRRRPDDAEAGRRDRGGRMARRTPGGPSTR